MTIPSTEEINKAREIYKDFSLDNWIHHDLFSWIWWLLLLSSIVPWLIWWKIVDKSKIQLIFSFGMCYSVISLVLDQLGYCFLLWGYPLKLIPAIPCLVPADLSVIPISFMIVYQLFPKGKAFFFACFVVSAIFSFVLEPIMEHIGVFEYGNWYGVYSFIGFVPVAYVSRWVAEKVHKKTAA